jgi:hypothetical protein
MSIEKKYNIPLETVQRMVKDGVISCSAVRYEEVYEAYLKYKTSSPGKSDSQIFYAMSDQMNMSDSSIKKIVYIMGKRS